jgi:hypothetical protein
LLLMQFSTTEFLTLFTFVEINIYQKTKIITLNMIN